MSTDWTALVEAKRRHAMVKGTLVALLLMGTFVWCALQLGIVPSRLANVVERSKFLLGLTLPPTLHQPSRILTAAIETIQIAILGTVFGVLLSVPLAFFAAKNVTPIGWASWLVKGIGALERAIPSLIWAILFIVAIGFGPSAGILALAVGSVGMLLKAYAESIEEIPEGPIEALRAMGASKVQIVFQGVLPAVLPVFVAWSVFRWDINVRYSTLLGIVGAGGLGFELIRAARNAEFDRALGVSLVILVIIMGSELLSNWLQRHIEGPDEDELMGTL